MIFDRNLRLNDLTHPHDLRFFRSYQNAIEIGTLHIFQYQPLDNLVGHHPWGDNIVFQIED